MNLKYLTIKCSDIEKSKSFYEALGLTPVKEKHGEGPEHFSFTLNDLTLELYPSKNKVEGSLILGLEIDFQVDIILERLKSISYNKELIKTKEGYFSIKDPDGNTIHLNERSG